MMVRAEFVIFSEKWDFVIHIVEVLSISRDIGSQSDINTN